MKKYLVFVGSFSAAFLVFQVLSGMLLTLVYTPSNTPWEEVGTLPSQVKFGSISFLPPLFIALLAMGVAYGVTKLINKKTV